MHIKSLSEGFFSFWICTLWPINITLAFNIARITNQVSPWVVLWLWKKQVLFPSTHMGNHYNMKYAHGDGQGGTGGEYNNLRQNRGRAHRNQFIPTRQVEQTLGLPCKVPLSKPAFRHENRQVLSIPKAKLAWPYQEGGFWCRAPAGQDTICRFEEMLWPHNYDCAVFPCDLLWFIRTFTDVKIQPSHKPDPTVLHQKHSQSQKDLLPPQEHPFLRVAHHPSFSIMGWRTTPLQ